MKTFEGKTWAMFAASILAVALVSAACSGDDDDDGADAELVSGTYSFTATDVPIDGCWPSDSGADPDVTAAIPITINVANSTSFTLSATGDAAGLFFPETEIGYHDGADIGSQLGPVYGELYFATVVVTTECSITISANMSGTVRDDGSLEMTIFSGLAVATLNSAGDAAANCTAHPADLFNGYVPFPDLLAVPYASTANCGVSMEGVAAAP